MHVALATNVSLVSTFSTRNNAIKRMYRLSRCSMSRPMLLQWLLLPLLLSLLAHTALSASTYFVTRSKSVKDNDINCNKLNSQGQPATYCYECGGIAAMAAKCSANARCRAFDMQDYDCGYLKTRGEPSVMQDQPGFTTFCKGEGGGFCSADWVVYIDYDAATGTDYSCNYKEEGKVMPFCRRDGDVIALMDECDRNAGGRCDGFVVSLESNGKFGWLKQAPGGNVLGNRRVRQGYMFFAKTRSNPKGHKRSLLQLDA